MPSYQPLEVAVPGGTLRGGVWGLRGPVVLCAHGITGTHVSFEALADQLGDGVRLVAPDHRGRGRSRDCNGPWGMTQHAADLVAVLDHLGLESADLMVGHSMGGFTAAVTAALYPQRVKRILMVDGGIPVIESTWITRLPFGDAIIEWIVRRIIGPSLTRLDMGFDSIESYRKFWRAHPALAADWSAYMEHYVDYDLVGQPPALRPSTRKDALLADIRSQLEENLMWNCLKQLNLPLRFLRAEGGLMNGKPLYPEKKLQKQLGRVRNASLRSVSGVNHFTIIISERGAREVAAEVRALLSP